MPPAAKQPGARRRRNVNEGPKWKTLPADSGRKAPPLPRRSPAWSKQTRDWWQTIWQSPMAALWLPADIGVLHDLAELRQRFWDGDPSLAAAIRTAEDRLGLSPKARNLLQWQVPNDPSTPAVPATEAEPDAPATPSSSPESNVRRLRAVDTG